MHFLRPYASATQRFRAGDPVPEGAIPAPQLAALVEAGIVAAAAPPEPAPAAPAAEA